MTSPSNDGSTILLIGASRGLGSAMAGDFCARGWRVTGTVRGNERSELHALADSYPGRVEVETLDVTEHGQIADLRRRLAPGGFDMLFVNAGTANRDPDAPVAQVAEEEFVRVMLTNVLGVMRTVEELQELVRPTGLIGVMSSGQGSIANNEKGRREVYRASKAALNQSMRSYAARCRGSDRAMVLMAPGWIRTALGGPDAPFTVQEAVPQVVDTLVAQLGRPGLRFLDRHGATVSW